MASFNAVAWNGATDDDVGEVNWMCLDYDADNAFFIEMPERGAANVEMRGKQYQAFVTLQDEDPENITWRFDFDRQAIRIQHSRDPDMTAPNTRTGSYFNFANKRSKNKETGLFNPLGLLCLKLLTEDDVAFRGDFAQR